MATLVIEAYTTPDTPPTYSVVKVRELRAPLHPDYSWDSEQAARELSNIRQQIGTHEGINPNRLEYRISVEP